MCGYARRKVTQEQLDKYVKITDLTRAYYNRQIQTEVLEHFYPAFGGAVSRRITGMIIQEEGEITSVDATWWFDCMEIDGDLVVNNKRTTFNARNLTSPYWKGAIRHHRGIALVTAIGEGKEIDGKNRHFFVEGETPILLGTVYRKFPNGQYSTAIITRDSHPRFEPYHDKAFPLMLPPDPHFLTLWLSEEPETHPAIAHLLENPRIFTGLKITPVQTFKDAKSAGETVYLEADECS